MKRPLVNATGTVRRPRGIALVLVLWVIMVLSLLIGGFAFTMHVEMQVASLGRKELKAEMLARSGIELARMQLTRHAQSPTEAGFDTRKQSWATNQQLYVDHELGEGKFNVKVVDEESKMPINRCTPAQLKRAITSSSIDLAEEDVIVDSILDWREPGDLHRLNGAKSEYYLGLTPPYRCKNGPLDQIEELLLVRGVTPEMFYGSSGSDTNSASLGLVNLFSTLTQGPVNVNTASVDVLSVWLGVEPAQIDIALNHRDGADGVAGTDDDQPFRTADDFLNLVAGVDPKLKPVIRGQIGVTSTSFTVTSTGEVGGVKRTIVATMKRQGANVTVATWRIQRGGA